MARPTSRPDQDLDQARRRFLALGVRAMRRVLIDHARQHRAQKRGGAWHRTTLGQLAAKAADPADLIDLVEALSRIEARSPRVSQVAELRLFGGLTFDEVAAALGLSPATIDADWASARALLSKALRAAETGDRSPPAR